MQSFNSMLTEKIEKDKKEQDQYHMNLKQEFLELQKSSQEAFGELKKFEESVLTITKNIIEPKFLNLTELLNNNHDYRQCLEQQLQQSLKEIQTIDLELMLYQTKSDIQFQDILKLLQSQQQYLQDELNKIMELLIQVQQSHNQHRESRSDFIQRIGLIQRMQEQVLNCTDDQTTLINHLKDQFGDGIVLMQKLDQQSQKIIWCIGIFGTFSILSTIISFI